MVQAAQLSDRTTSHDVTVRSAERLAVGTGTTIRVNAIPRDGEIFNLSTTGCLISTAATLEPGQHLRIGLPGAGAFLATVARTDGAAAGCRFHQPLSARQFSAAFRQDVVVDGGWPDAHPAPAQAPASDDLTPLAKLACITGLSAGLWAGIAMVARMVA